MIETTDFYWDCECPVDYIHSRMQEDWCPHCEATAEDQPDSRVNEVLADGRVLVDENGKRRLEKPADAGDAE